jgi:prepilin peptidase CpaA
MNYIIDGILVLLVLFSIYTDLKERKIFNVAVMPAIIAGLALNAYAEGTAGLLFGLKGAGLGLLLLLIPFIFGGFGAGDVKLMAAVGALKGPGFVFITFLGTGIAGGVLAVLVLVRQGRFIASVKRICANMAVMLGSAGRVNTMKNLDQAEYHESLPYAIAIGIGTMLAYLVR